MSRPQKGTPEYALWVAAIEVAIAAPLRYDPRTTSAAKIRWTAINELRAALDVLDIDWRDAKVKDDALRTEAEARVRARRTEANRGGETTL